MRDNKTHTHIKTHTLGITFHPPPSFHTRKMSLKPLLLELQEPVFLYFPGNGRIKISIKLTITTNPRRKGRKTNKKQQKD